MAFRVPIRLLSNEQKSQIRKDLTLREKIKYVIGPKGPTFKEIIFYSVDLKTQELLLPLHYACQFFKKSFLNQRLIYPKVPPFQVTTSLRDYQEEIVQMSLQNLHDRGTTFLNVFCSFGKTVVAAFLSAAISARYGLCTLVTYPLKMIESSWIGTFRDLTTAKLYIVGETQGPPDPDVQVFICMDTRLPALDPQIRAKIGHFVIDEADCFCTKGRVEALLSVEPLFITALTATYERDDGFEKMLDLTVGSDRIVRISKRPFFVFHRPTSFEVTPRVGPRGIIYDDLIGQYDIIPERNSLILETVLDNLSEKILILTKHVEHAENLHSWLTTYLTPHGKTCSLLAKTVRKYSDASVIVGTISKVGRGFDENKSCHDWKGERINLLILASSTKKIEQIAGRVFRADIPIIVDIVDNHKNVQNHWRIRRRWYESRNGIILHTTERFVWKNMFPQLMGQYQERLKSGIIPLTQEQEESKKLTDAHLESLRAKLASLSQGLSGRTPL